MELCDHGKIEWCEECEKEINNSIRIDRSFLIHIDSLLSLICSNRFTFTHNIPQDIIQDISHTIGKIRKLYQG
jgi:hypothetical protein